MPEAFASDRGRFRRWAPEMALAVLAGVMFLGSLGAVDLWGKREQRASAESIDTLDHDHWLIAEIQCRPRLEKPPLPRWTTAALMAATGRRDEWIVRLPGALSALAMVGLVYGLGRRMGGRSVGLASGLALTSLIFFVTETRQAGNDGPLALFTTLAVYAAWRRLHGGSSADHLGSWGWTLVFYLALGLGFLTKGPIVLILVALAVGPYLACARRFVPGFRALDSGLGVLLLVTLALSWPVAVLWKDPNAMRIWMLEIGQKAGTAGIKHHRERLLALEWPWMTAPWTLLATWAVLMPFSPRGRNARPAVWLAWSWTIANLGMFCLWSVAKPNYYLPCLPGVALLIGTDWVRITRMAREAEARGPRMRARAFLGIHWVVLAGLAVAGPILAVKNLGPGFWMPVLAASVVMAGCVAASLIVWRRGGDAGSLFPLVGGFTVALVVGYGVIAPAFNASKSHRELAARLDRVLPPDVKTVMFFRELDEGLWFYLKDRTLAPVPGSQPKYNKDIDLVDAVAEGTVIWTEAGRIAKEKKILVDWIKGADHQSPYVLVRGRVYDLFGEGMEELADPVFREEGLARHDLVLLKLKDAGTIASAKTAEPARR